MDTEPGGNIPGGSSSDPAQAPPPASPPPATPPPEPAPVAPTAKVEVKDGKVEVDGKKFVAESDLLAAKNSLEGKLTTQQTAHETAIDAAKLKESESQQTIATLNAKLQEVEEARKAGVVSDEDATKVKQDLEAAKGSLEKASTSSLEYRRALLVLQYGVAADTIKDKTMEQLDSFEEAVKALATTKGGVGPYAVGGGSEGAVPETNIERALKVIEATPVRGVRTAEVEK